MGRRRLTLSDLESLKGLAHLPIKELATTFNCDPLTVQRALYTLGLIQSNDARVIAAGGRQRQTWNRPCLKCGSTAPRPRWIYVCQRCKDNSNFNPAFILD